MCHTLKIAPTRVAKGFNAKFVAANVTAKPLFCIPTSIANAVVLSYLNLSIYPTPNPKSMPSILCMPTTSNVSKPEIKSLSLLMAIMAAINNIIAIIETIGLTLVNVLIRDLQTYWMIAPNNMGTIITFTIVIIIGSNATFTHVPPKYRISKGVTIGAINVEVIVIPTDKGTSPLAI